MVYALQEPHFYRDRLTSLPHGYMAVHAVPTRTVRTAVAAPLKLAPYAQSRLPTDFYAQVELLAVGGVVGTGYCPPKGQLSQHLPDFQTLFMWQQARWRLLALDSNAYHEAWGSDNRKRKTESINQKQWTRGQRLHEWIILQNGIILNDGCTQTYLLDQGFAAAIDVTIWWTRTTLPLPHWNVSDRLQVSDHFPILISIKAKSRSEAAAVLTAAVDAAAGNPFPYGARQPRQDKGTEQQWQRWREQLQQALMEYDPQIGTVDQAVAELTSLLQSIWSPKTPPKYPQKPRWWTPALQRQRAQYWKLSKSYSQQKRRVGDTEQTARLRSEYLRARRNYNRAVQLAKSQSWGKFLSEMTTPWMGYHRYLKGQRETRSLTFTDPENPQRPLRPDEVLDRIEQRLNVTANEAVGKPTAPYAYSHTRAERQMTMDWNMPITELEVMDAIWATPADKASGPDGLSPNIYKRCAVVLAPVLACIFERCRAACYFPTAWRAGEGILLPKGGKENRTSLEVKDFRIIVLYPLMGKVFERVILQRLQRYLRMNQGYLSQQHGFTGARSCVTALATLVDSLQEGLAARKRVAAVFLDVAGAFDRVPHGQLEISLRALGLPTMLCDLLSSYLTQRLVRLSLHTVQKVVHCRQGTPQGGVLSPQLWLCYMNLLLRDLQGLRSVRHQAYADDLVIWCVHKQPKQIESSLQFALRKLEEWGARYQLTFQPTKCQVMAFRYRHSPPTICLSLYQQRLPQTAEVRYLGVTLDSRFTWLPHIKGVVRKMAPYINRLLPSLRTYQALNKQTAAKIYTAAIVPNFTYRAFVWGIAAHRSQTKKVIARGLRSYLLMVARVPPTAANSLLHRLTQLPPIADVIRHLTLKAAVTNEYLYSSFVVPWLTDKKRQGYRKGCQLRNFLHTLFVQHRQNIQVYQEASCGVVSAGARVQLLPRLHLVLRNSPLRSKSVLQIVHDCSAWLFSLAFTDRRTRQIGLHLLLRTGRPCLVVQCQVQLNHDDDELLVLLMMFIRVMQTHAHTHGEITPQHYTPARPAYNIYIETQMQPCVSRYHAVLPHCTPLAALLGRFTAISLHWFSTCTAPNVSWCQLVRRELFTTCFKPHCLHRSVPTTSDTPPLRLRAARKQCLEAVTELRSRT